VAWELGTAAAAFFLAFGIYIVAGSILLAAARGLYKHHNLLFNVVAYQILVLGVIASALSFVLVRFRAGPAVLGYRFPGWAPILKSVAVVPVTFIAIAVLYGIFSTLLPGYHLQGNARQELVQNPHQHLSLGLKVVVLIWSAVEAPFTEETLFRGIIYQGLRDFSARKLPFPVAIGAGALVSGALFGLVHGEIRTFPILMLLGVILALVFQRWRSIYCSVVIHGIINAIAVFSVLSS
ncbi:MAG: lysostaphin resistance A-like protein, partial [Chloroflexota bacterium]